MTVRMMTSSVVTSEFIYSVLCFSLMFPSRSVFCMNDLTSSSTQKMVSQYAIITAFVLSAHTAIKPFQVQDVLNVS